MELEMGSITRLKSLIEDLNELNLRFNTNLTLNLVTEHTEYSAERTDPCPDYYGMYYIKEENGDILGDYMTLDELDNNLFYLNEYAEYLRSK